MPPAPPKPPPAQPGLPLAGLKVVELGHYIAAPFATRLLADLGAEVIKVEPPEGDPVRGWGAQVDGNAVWFSVHGRNKLSVTLDLKSAAGKARLLRLAGRADALVENFRPGQLERYGLGPAALHAANPRLVIARISGYGQDGPYRDRPGHDINYLALGGLLGLSGERDGPPVQSAGQIADLGGGALMAAFGVMAALHERRASGEGQLVDISMTDGAMSWLGMVAGKYFADGTVTKRGGNELAGSIVCYRPYAASDGWVTLGALEPKFWQAWCRGVGREDLIEKQFEAPGSDAHREVEQVFAARTRDEWRRFAAEHDCCLEPVLGLDEAIDSELTQARTMVVEIDQPGAENPVRGIGNPVKLSRTPGEVGAPAPSLGEHTDEVLEEAGYSAEEIAGLKESGAAAGLAEGQKGAFLA